MRGGTVEDLSTRTDDEIAAIEPYVFFAMLGKRVVHPGGRPSTAEIYRMGHFEAEQRVLEVGCGLGATAIDLARRFGCHVTAIDIDPFMVEHAREAVREAGLEALVTVEQADAQRLPYADESFDRVVIEAVTQFLDHIAVAREMVRVCRHGGRVIDHEFAWRRTPPDETRASVEVDLCPSSIRSNEGWVALYEQFGLKDVEVTTGTPSMLSPFGLVRDEGFAGSMRFVRNVFSRGANRKKTFLVMKQLGKAMPYLGWIVVAGVRP
jgi:SAM-dependent methyltransferase